MKGYEYSKGKFVVLTPKDFEEAALEKSKTLDIIDFAKDEEIDWWKPRARESRRRRRASNEGKPAPESAVPPSGAFESCG